LSFPLEDFDQEPSAWDSATVKNAGWANERVLLQTQLPVREGVSVFVGVASMPEGSRYRHWGKVELNPSRVLEPGGYGLADPDDLPAAVGLAVGAALRVVKPVDSDTRQWNVKRCDVAKDFVGVDEPGALLRGLASLHRPWSRKNLIHADPTRNGAETLMVGSGAGVVRGYRKDIESKGVAPEGTIRVEAECRAAWAENYGGVKFFGQMNGDSLERLGRNRWEWSQMGAEVAGSMGRLVQVVRDSELSARERRSFLGWLVEQSAGDVDEDGMSRATLANYRRFQREIGIAAPADFGSMVEVVRRLDWDSGREVLRVA
jgi:hypothetical protein